MPVCRLIYRFDFKANFEIVNRPGTVMKLTSDVPEDFWDDLRESREAHQIVRTYKSDSDGLARSLTVEPTTIFALIESIAGIEFGHLEKNQSFDKLLRVMRALCEEFGINELKRSGLRLFYFSRLGNKEDEVKSAYRELFDKRVTKAVEKTLGEMTDYGMAIDGIHKDKISYHYRSGPYAANEAGKWMVAFADRFRKEATFDFICDVDMFEQNFATPKTTLIKWCQPILVRAGEIISWTESLLSKQIGGKK